MRQNDALDSSRATIVIASILLIAALHYAREVLVPLAFALLLTFLLAPVVSRLQKWRVPRIPAVAVTMILATGAIGTLTYGVTMQLLDVTAELPKYRANIHNKLEALHRPKFGPLAQVSAGVKTIT